MARESHDTFGHEEQFRFSVGKMEELPFCESCFDVVICLGVFEYVMESHVAMEEVTRVLKPNGILIITMLNGASLYRLWQRFIYWKAQNGKHKIKRYMVGEKTNPRGKPSSMVIFKEADFRRLLVSHGLEIKDVLYYDFNVLVNPFDKIFPRASVYISEKLEYLYRSRWKFLGTGYMLKCKKS